MHAWEAIQNSLNHIEDNLTEEIDTAALAKAAALSPYYFQRLFGRLVKKPVNEYVKLRRLAKASEALKNKEKRIIDVALDYRFSDHANFTRAFKDAYGITPEEYRNCPFMLDHFVKPDLLLNRAMVDEDVPLIADGVVVEVTRRILDGARTFIGITAEVPVTELSGGKTTGVSAIGILWEEFHRRKPMIPHLLPNGNELGVLYAKGAGEGCCAYMTGAEAAGSLKAEGYDSFVLQSGEYLICRIEAESFAELVGSAVFKASSFMNLWMKKHRLACGNFVAELYSMNPGDSYMELWLPFRPAEGSRKRKETWDKTNGARKPSLDTVSAYVNSPLWERLCSHLEAGYQSKPVLEYSKCSLQYGWNVKYKKAGRTLCTLYPMEGYYIALVVVGERERAETELMLPFFTEYLQQLYRQTNSGMGQKWLMINVTEDAVLEDVKKCIAIRRGTKKK